MDDKIQAILGGLNEEQAAAVECTNGAVLIVAGAGSGKTRVLTSRIAYMLAKGIPPEDILALTFTKKAASEMRERIAAMVGAYSSRRIAMGTFHSVFVRFLRKYAPSIGYPEKFTIYDTSDSASAIKSCIKELGLDDKVYKPKEVLSRISNAKNNLITVSAYKSNRDLLVSDTYSKRPRLCDLYELYQRRLKASGVMDFDDILVNMNILLKDNADALKALSEQYKYIMVDEYQDTNYAQYVILKKLSRTRGNICVVGDDSQSIYAFRGAKIENILNFKKDNPQCRVFRLERNYRSTRTIVEAANSLIAHNSSRIPKTCYAEGEKGEGIKIIKSYSAEEEAANIVYEIQSLLRSRHAAYSDFAILYRTNAQSRALEEQLRRRNIPYAIVSGNSFFERAEVKDMMAYFKLCVNPDDNESFRRAVNKPARGIGEVTLNALSEAATVGNISMFRVGFSVPKVRPFCEMIEKLSSLVSSTGADEMAGKISDESGLYAYYKADTSIEGLSRTANVEELLSSVKAFVEERQQDEQNFPEDEIKPLYSLDDFLENVSLLSSVDIENEDEDGDNKVSLMTVHSAKGLEFPYVFISGLEENLFPSQSMTYSLNDLEEERRLFYVALTRAETRVYLSFALTRLRNGKHESNAPSRFIREIDPQCIENPLDESDYSNEGVRHEWGGFGERFTGGRFDSLSRPQAPSYGYKRETPTVRVIPKPTPKAAPTVQTDPNFEAAPVSEFYEGQRIEHNRFGAGEIISLSGRVPDVRAEVKFDNFGVKTLLLRYAQMRPEKSRK